ncbi:MAG: tRNA (adenosine(37)-N6)-dimethylallyltransferase MiaA [Candidatus Saccharimonadales bacterium]
MVSANLASKCQLPLVVIVGPTASGKTSLSIDLAREFNGEIICADSRTIYKGMDIGTAKPSLEEQSIVPHWGIDLKYPDESFNVADFKAYADQKIMEIRARGHVPFLVGGTGLYVDSVLYNYTFGPPADPALRAELDVLDIQQLHEYCNNNNIELPENSKNKRYIIRAIEQKGISTNRLSEPISNSIVVGIATDMKTLRERIAYRTEQLFDNGVVEEATTLGKKYGWETEAMTANIYRLVHSYLENEISLDGAKEKFTTLDYQLAKRQMTWLRRSEYITWLDLSSAKDYLVETLVKQTRP